MLEITSPSVAQGTQPTCASPRAGGVPHCRSILSHNREGPKKTCMWWPLARSRNLPQDLADGQSKNLCFEKTLNPQYNSPQAHHSSQEGKYYSKRCKQCWR